MAEKTIRIDDIDGTTEDVSPIQFGLGKNTYTIDLKPQHRDQLEEALRPFIEHATKQTPPRKKRTNAPTKMVRQWAKQQGIDVPEKGRIPIDIVSQYQAQHTNQQGESDHTPVNHHVD